MKNLNLKKYFIIVLGFSVIVSYIWFRFLRTRVPRKLPFTLLVLTFIFLLFSTALYLYITFRLFKPTIKENNAVQQLSSLFYLPLEEFDSFLKSYITFDTLLLKIHQKSSNINRFYFVTNILPRLITSSVLVIDIFIFFRFQYVYNIIFITMIPLLTRYYIYCLNKLLNQKISVLSNDFAFVSTGYVYGVHPDDWPENQTKEDDEDDLVFDSSDTMHLELKIFIPYQTKCILYNKETPQYSVYLPMKLYSKSVPKEKLREQELSIKNSIEALLQISVFLIKYKNILLENKLLRNIKAFLYGIYIISWSYIIFYTAPKVLWNTGLTSLLHTLQMIEDPFSGQLILCDIYNDVSTFF